VQAYFTLLLQQRLKNILEDCVQLNRIRRKANLVNGLFPFLHRPRKRLTFDYPHGSGKLLRPDPSQFIEEFDEPNETTQSRQLPTEGTFSALAANPMNKTLSIVVCSMMFAPRMFFSLSAPSAIHSMFRDKYCIPCGS